MDGHPIPGDYTEPPPPLTFALIPAGIGALLSAFSAFGTESGLLLAGPMALLATLGLIVAGASLTLDPRAPALWLCAFVASSLSSLGYGSDWDSMRLLARVLAGGSLLGMLLSALPIRATCFVGIVWLAFHFTGILSAVTLPPPQPWLSHQMWTRVYRPYLQFIYMNNAYQFYSPDPGPASELWWCVMYEKIDPTPEELEKPPKVHRWVKMPRREVDFRDPLGMVYYRRLALTEQLAQFNSNLNMQPVENEEVSRRRNLRNDIRDHPDLPLMARFRPPTEQTQRFVLPSFASIASRQYPKPDPRYFDNVDDYRIKCVYMYRAEHRIVPMPSFVGVRDPDDRTIQYPPVHPWNPTMYLPYFQGEFLPDPDKPGSVVLKAQPDPMLFWIVPITTRPDVRISMETKPVSFEKYFEFFDDNVFKHAGSDHRLPDGGTSGRKFK